MIPLKLLSSAGLTVMRTMRFATLFFLVYIITVPSQAQSVRSITTKDGLPQSFISGLVQDDSSFIWIGTRNGLARFDGMQYKIFQHYAYDTASLSSNIIIWLKKDHNNRLWIEHESGDIDMINPVTEKISHLLKGNQQANNTVKFVRRGWMVDSDGFFWGIIRSGGLNIYNAKTHKINQFTSAGSTLPSDTVKGMVENEKKEIWLVTQHAISVYDKKQNRFTNWNIPWQQDYGDFAESDAIAIDLHERKNKELMWGDRSTLYFFNTTTHTFRKTSIPTSGYMGIRWIRTATDGTDYLESYGKIYAYTETNSVTPIGNTITHSFGDVKAFLVDRSGVLWMGTNAKGIQQVDLETPFFESFAYKKDFGNDMLMQEFGIDIQKQFRWNEGNQIFSSPSYHLRTAYDQKKQLYFALKETVCYYDSAQKKIVTLPRVPITNNPAEKGIGIKGIAITATNEPMVIGYNGKIFVYHFSSAEWRSFIDPELLRKQFGPLLLPQDICVDDKNCWITTENDGLLKIDLVTKDIVQFKEQHKQGSMPANQLLGIRPDAVDHNICWIGSYQGLIRFNKTTLQCDVFALKEHLPDNTVYSILTDKSGNLWFTTNKGLCKFDPVSHNMRVFHSQHGLPGEEFNRFHHLQLPDGRLIFGGTDGWIKFDALAMKDDTYEPVVAFTDLRINNKEVVSSEKDSDLALPLNALKEMVLPYEKNTLTIEFAGLEYTQPQDLLYRYKLVGYNKDWVVVGKAKQASYTKIPPGTYTLLVNASNTTGKWSPFVKTLKLKILSPWWASWMAYLCYSIIIAGLVLTFIRFRVGRELMKKEMVLKEKETAQLKELDDMKSRFFSNITHEFRTPLTLILGPAEQLKTSTTDKAKQTSLADTIVRNAKQLLVLINRLMDLSKLEARAMKLHEQRGNPATVIGAVVHSFENDAEARKVALSFSDQSALTDCWFYPDAVERIVYNLVSNALKFTPIGGSVSVVLSNNENQLRLTVTDTGTGIADEKLPHIFDRYYQAGDVTGLAKETVDKGTGIGLAMVKELVNQMQGNITVESSVINPSGTGFVLMLPFRAAEATGKQVILQQSQGTAELLPVHNKAQLLLVEDNEELAAFVTDILREDYQVKHVLNGAEGLEHALTIMPDLIISDVMMPVMDGYEFTSRIKEDIRTGHIPVIMLTAKIAHEHLIEGLSKGADDYLTKPFHPTELLLRIQNQLSRQQRLRDRLRQELATQVMAETVSVVEKPEPIVEDVFLVKLYGLIDEHMDDAQFGVDQLAGIMNISRSSLHRKLKALTDMSTTEVVRNYRLKKATLFLKEGFSSSETAYKSGFGSPAYFTKCFREVYRITPGDFIQKIKNKPVTES
jgi:signal transduction histidine kinase/CheY-like chemotaxis protein/ligand-binding sensor domain-containing protein